MSATEPRQTRRRLRPGRARVLGLAAAVWLAAAGDARARPGSDDGDGAAKDDDKLELALPFQIAVLGYVPRVRVGLSYGHRFGRGHWLTVGAAALLDRGGHATFGEDPCGRREVPNTKVCEPGTVAGLDGQLGYVHWFRVDARPRLVPVVRVGATGGWWRYPSANGVFLHQDRDQSWMIGGRVGGGLRGLVRPRFAMGFDVDATVAFVRHLDVPLYEYATWSSGVLVGVGVLSCLEYLF